MTAGGSSPTHPHPPPAKRRIDPSNTTIHCLTQDLLLEIFLRLPSLAALVRAALTCRLWRRAVASSPAFRRRFRSLHSSPLLGFFLPDARAERGPHSHAFPAFVPARYDRDLTAAIRGGDFFLTSVQELLEECLCWGIMDCCRGCALLLNGYDASFVVFNPLTRRCADSIHMYPDKDTSDGHRGRYRRLNPRLLFPDEDSTLFRVICLAHDESSRVRAIVFSSDTWEWSVHPWVHVPARSDPDNWYWVLDEGGMQANESLYWAYEDQRYLISLDIATMEFSVSELPDYLRFCTFSVGETKDEATCIVYSDQLNIGVLMHTKEDDGIEKWVPTRVVPRDAELQRVLDYEWAECELIVLAVKSGYAYCAVAYDDPQIPSWYLSLCLETMKLKKMFRRTFDNDVHPCIMAWPPALLGNCGTFALEDLP